MSAVLVYLDRKTSQVIRVNFNIRMVPASLDETYFIYHDTDRMPKDIVANQEWYKLEHVFISGDYIVSSKPVDYARIKLLNNRLDCIERLQGMMNRIRMNKSINSMIGAADLSLMYQKEIDEFDSTGTTGPLLSSRVTDDTPIEAVVAEYKIFSDSYKNVLIMTESILNQYVPQLRSSLDPYGIMMEIQEKYGARFRL
jgi:hypothetical protein